ncbi:MAG: hypothetical protein ACKPJO_22860 [Dolichospermum sp.]
MSTKSDKVLSEIKNGVWNGKNNLLVTEDVVSALKDGNPWFELQLQIAFAKEQLPQLYSILDYFKENEEEYHIENIASEILESSYGVNRAFNSEENKGPLENDDVFSLINYQAALDVNNLILDYEHYNNSSYMGDVSDIFNRVAAMESSNHFMLRELWDVLRAAIAALLGTLLQIIGQIILTILKALLANQLNTKAVLSIVPIPGLSEFYMQISTPIISGIATLLEAAKSSIESLINDINKNIDGFLLTVIARVDQFIETWNSIVTNFVEFTKIIGKVWKFTQNFVQSLGLKPREKTLIYATVRPHLTKARDDARKVKQDFKIVNEVIKSQRKEVKKTSKELVFIDNLLKLPKYENDALKHLFIPVAASYGQIAPVDLPSKVDVANIIKQIAESILSTFVLKGVGIPADFFEAIKEITAALVLKNIEQSGVDEIKYFVADIFKEAIEILPRVFNELGMFTGAYSVLIACAPYILAAGAIIMLALEYAKRTKLGDFIVIACYKSNQQEPDITCAGVDGKDTMKDIDKLINSMTERTFKEYDSIIVMTHDKSFFDRRLGRCFKYINKKLIALTEEESKIVDEQVRTFDFMGVF